MFYSLYRHQWNTKPFHFNSFLVWKARFILLIYFILHLLCVVAWPDSPEQMSSSLAYPASSSSRASCACTCSHSKGHGYFHMWRYQVFARKLTWYFIGVYKICRTTFGSRVGWVTIYLLCVLAWPDCPEQMSSSLAYPASSSSRASCACTSAFSRKRSVPDRWRNSSSASSPWCSRVVETWLNRFDRCPATGVE